VVPGVLDHATGPEVLRHPEVDRARERVLEAGRHDADHSVLHAVELDRGAQALPIEPGPAPEPRRDHRQRLARLLLAGEPAPQNRLPAEQPEVVGAHRQDADPPSAVADQEVHPDWMVGVERGQVLEGGGPLPVVLEVGGAHEEVLLRLVGVELVEPHELPGPLVRQGLEEHGADHAEDRRGAADAEGQGEDRGSGEAGPRAERPGAVAQVGEEVLEAPDPAPVPDLLLGPLDAAEGEPGRAPRLSGAKYSVSEIRSHSAADPSALAALRSLRHSPRYASVPRLARAAPRRPRCVTVFPPRST
jgi:hypothetical protein